MVFYHEPRDLLCVCLGHDFTLVGEEYLLWIATKMRKWFEIKVRALLGPEANDDNEVVILGRVVRWMGSGMEF